MSPATITASHPSPPAYPICYHSANASRKRSDRRLFSARCGFGARLHVVSSYRLGSNPPGGVAGGIGRAGQHIAATDPAETRAHHANRRPAEGAIGRWSSARSLLHV